MRIFLGPDVSKESLYFAVWHCIALVEIAKRSRKLTVRTAEL